MISRCRSASARIFSLSALPVARSSLATRLRSASMRRYTDFQREIDTFQAYVQHLDANFARIGIRLGAQQLHDLVACAGHHFVDGALAEFLAHAGIDRLQQTVSGARLVA